MLAMPKSRKERRPRRKARHSSRDGAEPAVFRLPEVSEAARKLSASSAKAAEADVSHAAPGDGDSMAALLDDVAPLRAPERVARAAVRKDENAERRAASRARRELTFVVERDGERVEGYRSDCSRPNVAPGSRRDWVPTHHIDLHGVRIRDLEQRLTRGIRECVERHGFRLLVIHGKGLHSTGGSSVLADAVLESLTSERHARHVRAFSTAPERLGGAGALAVELDVGAR
jgi:DNA-nicking Smr family endonuclease